MQGRVSPTLQENLRWGAGIPKKHGEGRLIFDFAQSLVQTPGGDLGIGRD
jgi:hypothetical protein